MGSQHRACRSAGCPAKRRRRPPREQPERGLCTPGTGASCLASRASGTLASAWPSRPRTHAMCPNTKAGPGQPEPAGMLTAPTQARRYRNTWPRRQPASGRMTPTAPGENGHHRSCPAEIGVASSAARGSILVERPWSCRDRGRIQVTPTRGIVRHGCGRSVGGLWPR